MIFPLLHPARQWKVKGSDFLANDEFLQLYKASAIFLNNDKISNKNFMKKS